MSRAAQAAYEAYYPASDRSTEIVPWDRLTSRGREPWEAAAQAAIGAASTEPPAVQIAPCPVEGHDG